MSMICVDASIVLRLVLGGPLSDQIAEQWARWNKNQVSFIAPPLFAFEVTSSIWRKVYQGQLTNDQGLKALKAAFRLGVQLKHPANLHKRAWSIAKRFRQPAAYDAHYVALAAHVRCEFWTVDEKLFKRLNPHLPFVKTLS